MAPPWDAGAVEEARDEETIADIRRFRAEFELPTDDALIEYFLREHHADRMPMPGMWLTPNEAELHSRHEELIERARQSRSRATSSVTARPWRRWRRTRACSSFARTSERKPSSRR